MPSPLSELGELQMAVMNVLWTRSPLTVHEVLAALPGERKLAYTTVLTVLRNLEKRGLVAHEQTVGTRMFRYLPLLTADEARAGILEDVTQRLFSDSTAALIVYLLETNSFSDDEMQRFSQFLSALRPPATERKRAS